MKKRLLNSLALCSLVCLGTIGLVSCGDSFAIDRLNNVVNAEGKLEAKVNVTYTLGLNIHALENDTVVWTSDAPSAVTLVKGDEKGLTCDFTVKQAGNFTISAYLDSNPTKLASVDVVARKGQESYVVDIETKDVKKTYLQGDRFTSKGLEVSRVLTVDGKATNVRTTLTEDDYKVDITEGTILSAPGELPINVTVEGIDKPAVYEITIAENPVYPFIEFARGLQNNNYSIIQLLGDQAAVTRAVSNDYVIDAILGEVYQNTEAGVTKYVMKDDQTLANKGLFYADILTPAADINELNQIQGYALGSDFKEEWLKDVKKTNVDIGQGVTTPGFKISKAMTEYFLNLTGNRFLTVNTTVVDGAAIIENGIAEIICNLNVSTEQGAQTLQYPVIIGNVGETFEPTFEELMKKAPVDKTVNAGLKKAIDIMANGNYTFRTDPAMNPNTGLYQYSEFTQTDNYSISGAFEAPKADLVGAVGHEFGFVNCPSVEGQDPTVIQVEITQDAGLVPNENAAPGFTTYKEIAFGDESLQGVQYVLDTNSWYAFAQPGRFEQMKDGIYEHWNLEYVRYTDQGKLATESYALYGENGALDIMYNLFGVPYGRFLNIGGRYHSVMLDVNYNEDGSYKDFNLSVRVTFSLDSDFKEFKGLPVPWDSGTVVAQGENAKHAKVEEYLAGLNTPTKDVTKASL